VKDFGVCEAVRGNEGEEDGKGVRQMSEELPEMNRVLSAVTSTFSKKRNCPGGREESHVK
jgi:hypothetical protein